MKEKKAAQVFAIIYPVFLYFVMTAVALSLLDYILPESVDTKLSRQLATSLVALPMLAVFYRKEKKEGGAKQTRIFFVLAVMFATGGCFALAFNDLLGLFRLVEYSPSYVQVEETFYTGRLMLEILALCIVIPIVEELLYRGIVLQRCVAAFGDRAAVFVSAAVFGLLHMNLAQFVYAAVFGVLLAYVTNVTGSIAGAIAAHMAANLTSTLRAELGLFAFADAGPAILALAMAGLFGVAGMGIFMIWKMAKEETFL